MFCVFQSREMGTIITKLSRIRKASGRDRRSLLISLALLAAICNVPVARGAAEEGDPSTLAFERVGGFRRLTDMSHIVVRLNLEQPLDYYRLLDNAINETQTTILKDLQDSLDFWTKQAAGAGYSSDRVASTAAQKRVEIRRTNATFQDLRKHLWGVKEELQYVCELCGCTLESRGEVPNSTNPSDDDDHLNREKRQLAIAAVGGLIGLGLSIYNAIELRQLSDQLDELSEDVYIIHTMVNENRLAINKNSKAISKVADLIREGEAWRMVASQLRRRDEVAYGIAQATLDLRQYNEALLEVLLDKKLNPRLFQAQALIDALADLKTRAERVAKKPVYENFEQLLGADISYIVEDSEMKLFVHVPLADTEEYDLYKFESAPVRLDNGDTVRVRTDAKYLAVNQPLTSFQDLDDQGLRECLRVGGNYACWSGVLAKNPASSCLAGIFTKTEEAVKAHCDLMRTTEKTETLLPIGPNEALVSAPTNEKVDVIFRCRARSQKGPAPITVSTQQKIHVPRGCVITTPNFSWEPAAHSGIISRIEARPLFPDGVLDSLEDYKLTSPNSHFVYEPRLLPERGAAHPVLRHSHAAANFAVLLLVVVVIGVSMFWVTRVLKEERRRESARRSVEATFDEEGSAGGIEMKPLAAKVVKVVEVVKASKAQKKK